MINNHENPSGEGKESTWNGRKLSHGFNLYQMKNLCSFIMRLLEWSWNTNIPRAPHRGFLFGGLDDDGGGLLGHWIVFKAFQEKG